MNARTFTIATLCLAAGLFGAQQSSASGGADIGYHLYIDPESWHSDRSEALATFFRGATVESIRPFLDNEALLQQAARYARNADLVTFLVASGFDPNAALGYGVQEYPQDRGPESREGPLHWAAAYNPASSVVEALVKAGADVHSKAGGSLETPLHRAARYNNAAVVLALIKGGADPNAINGRISANWNRSPNINGNTPLHEAACNEDSSVIEALVGAGAEVARRNSSGFLPLHFAVLCKRSGSTAALARLGADLGGVVTLVEEGDEMHDCTGCNVVHLLLNSMIEQNSNGEEQAVPERSMQFLQALVDDGASINAEVLDPGMYAGYTPLRLAIEGDLGPVVVSLLLELGARVESDLLHALLAGWFQYTGKYAGGSRARDVGAASNLDVLDLLLSQKDIDVNTRDHCGRTPLHRAVSFGYGKGDGVDKMVAKLIAAGADVDARRQVGAEANAGSCRHAAFTPLHEALRLRVDGGSAYAIISMLLAAGADPNAPNMSGKSALDLAVSDRMKALLSGGSKEGPG